MYNHISLTRQVLERLGNKKELEGDCFNNLLSIYQ